MNITINTELARGLDLNIIEAALAEMMTLPQPEETEREKLERPIAVASSGFGTHFLFSDTAHCERALEEMKASEKMKDIEKYEVEGHGRILTITAGLPDEAKAFKAEVHFCIAQLLHNEKQVEHIDYVDIFSRANHIWFNDVK